MILILILALALPVSTAAQGGSTLAGTVLGPDARPVADAAVTVTGQNVRLTATTDASGRFAFTTLTPGEYVVAAQKSTLHAVEGVALASQGVEMTIVLAPLGVIGRVAVGRSLSESGTDVTIGVSQLVRIPSESSLSGILSQLPSAARGSNGQVHVNGDHNGLNYYLDGVQLPASLNRVLGSEIDPADIGFVDALEGAYPAQYGERFAAVINMGSRTAGGAASLSGSIDSGSFGKNDAQLSYRAPLGSNGALSVATDSGVTERALDPPVRDPMHDRGSNVGQFLRATIPVHGTDTLNLDMLHSLQSFQIPPDTAGGVPASADDDEYQDDAFASLQFRHAIDDRGSLAAAVSMKIEHILDTDDVASDLAGGSGSGCTDFTDCAFYAVYADRFARDVRLNVDYELRSGRHDVRAGVLYGATDVTKDYRITLQPGNALEPGGGAFVATDQSPNIAHQQEAYVSDEWKMGSLYRLDYGLRSDSFQIFSDDFDRGFAQVSPRVKLTRSLGAHASVYAYFGRLFVPFSFENVSPATAAALYTPANNPGDGFDLRPQRDSLYELGGHVALGLVELGVRVSHKVSTDWLDDTQIGSTNLHQDINFPRGRVDLESAYVQRALARSGRLYAAVTHSIAVNSSNCETQLLQNCAIDGPPGGDFVQADHDQHWDINGGVLVNDAHGGWSSADLEYGSGLSADPSTCASGDAVNCKVPPHLTVDVERGIAVGRASLALVIDNLFDDRYAITLNSSLQGTHYAAPRGVKVRVSW
jgi:hypothetical protein